MSYYKFDKDDVFYNSIKTHPESFIAAASTTTIKDLKPASCMMAKCYTRQQVVLASMS